jgi:hypothetical protein
MLATEGVIKNARSTKLPRFVWLGVDLRTYIKNTCVSKGLYYVHDMCSNFFILKILTCGPLQNDLEGPFVNKYMF